MTGPRHTHNSDDPDEPNEWGMPKIREPDFSDVRRHIFAPWRLLLFVTIAIVFWLIYYHFFPPTGQPAPKQAKPAAADSQK